MKPNRKVTVVFSAILAASLAASVAILGPLDRVRARTADDVLFISSPQALKRLSFKYTGLMADIYWTRTVQYYGRLRASKPRQYPLLSPLLDITTTLDPNLVVAYQFGSVFLSQNPPEGAGQPDKAIELVQRGIKANPGDWHLYFDLAFIYYDQRDYASAARTFLAGSGLTDAPPGMKGMAAECTDKGGSPAGAKMLWTTLYESTKNEAIRKGALYHLVALQIDEDVPALAKLVRIFRERTGRYPTNFEEMVAAGWLKSVPLDPTGDAYILRPNGRVEVQSPEKNWLIRYGLPKGPQGPEDETGPRAANDSTPDVQNFSPKNN